MHPISPPTVPVLKYFVRRFDVVASRSASAGFLCALRVADENYFRTVMYEFPTPDCIPLDDQCGRGTP
jgi:hypothetical protein